MRRLFDCVHVSHTASSLSFNKVLNSLEANKVSLECIGIFHENSMHHISLKIHILSSLPSKGDVVETKHTNKIFLQCHCNVL